MELKVALVGCGSIGQIIAEAIREGDVEASLVAVFDMDVEAAREVSLRFAEAPIVANDMNDIFTSHADIVVEAASVKALGAVAVPILKAGKDLMLMSVGALANADFLEEVTATAKENGRKVYAPSGAIGGLDALRSAMAAGVQEVTITTTKNPRALTGAPYLAEKGIQPENIKEKTVIFQGSAREAIEGFPANTNVAVALSLAGIGVDETKAMVVADPATERNTHEVWVKGDFGEFTFRVDNLPSPSNPRTSYLAALSAVATLKKLTNPLQIGT